MHTCDQPSILNTQDSLGLWHPALCIVPGTCDNLAVCRVSELWWWPRTVCRAVHTGEAWCSNACLELGLAMLLPHAWKFETLHPILQAHVQGSKEYRTCSAQQVRPDQGLGHTQLHWAVNMHNYHQLYSQGQWSTLHGPCCLAGMQTHRQLLQEQIAGGLGPGVKYLVYSGYLCAWGDSAVVEGIPRRGNCWLKTISKPPLFLFGE